MEYNKGFAPVLIAIIIAGALVIGGGAYYWGKYKGENKKVGENSNEVKSVDQVNKNIEKKGVKTQVNINAGYQVEYPSDWYVKSVDTKISPNGNYGYNAFIIQNTKDAVLPGSDFTLKANGSYINISVDTNMNYSNYEEFMKDPKTDLPKLAKDERIANLEMINIGGKTLQGLNSFKNGISGGSYTFIYNKKQYQIGIDSGSENQFVKDKKIFEDMVSSFKFIDSEESTLTKDVTNQPVYLKSVYVKNGKNYIDVDYIQWVACAYSETNGCMNGYDIINDNPLIRTFLISDNVVIKMQTFSHQTSGPDKGNYNWNESVSLQKFKGIIDGSIMSPDYQGSLPYTSHFKQLPYSITVKNNIVTEITERYIP
ncbi:MAG: hypothetical protein WC241_01245 [Candidatus Paceibacterota bacterium]|jgi:hypothetical protein